MGKNIAKSLFWYGLYTVSQTIIMFIIILIGLFQNRFNFFSSGDTDIITENLIEYINEITLPILIFTALIVCLVYLIFVLTKKKKVDLGHIEFDKFSFMAMTGINYNFILTIIIGIFTFFLTLLFPDIAEQIETANSSNAIINVHPFIISLLGTGILIPIMEEIVFRYGICGVIGRSNRTAGIVVSSIFFGLAHGNPIQVIYTMILGFVLAIVYTKYDNIWYPIITHITFNSLTVIAGAVGSEIITYILGIISIIATIIMICCNKEIKSLLKLPKIEKPVSQSNPQSIFVQGQYFPYPVQQNVVYQHPNLANIYNKYAIQQPIQQPIQYTNQNTQQNNINGGNQYVR